MPSEEEIPTARSPALVPGPFHGIKRIIVVSQRVRLPQASHWTRGAFIVTHTGVSPGGAAFQRS